MEQVTMSNLSSQKLDAVALLPRPAMRLHDVSVSFNGRTAVRNVTFDVAANKVTLSLIHISEPTRPY